jgi:hypothetical protein
VTLLDSKNEEDTENGGNKTNEPFLNIEKFFLATAGEPN